MRQQTFAGVWAVAALVALTPLRASAAEEIVVIAGGGAKRSRVVLVEGPSGGEAALEDVAAGLDVDFVHAPARVTVKSRGREVVLDEGKSLFGVSGQIKALPAPVRIVGARTYLTPQAVAVVMTAALGEPATYRAAFRTLVIGPFEAPRLNATVSIAATSVTVTLEFSKRVPVAVRREPTRVVAEIGADIVETTFREEAVPGRVLESARFEARTPPVMAFAVGERFVSLKTSESEGPPYRFVLEFQTTNAEATPAVPGAIKTPTPGPSPIQGGRAPLVVVIDPGHGGGDTGAHGPSGHLEKDLVMAIARRLRSAIVDTIGGQAYLTRDGDTSVPALDDRAGIANNFNADVFISLHANGSRAASASGTEVFFLSYKVVDDDARRLAQVEGDASLGPPGASGDVGLILWDMAQAASLQSSETLAAAIQEEVSKATGTPMRGVKQAPFRVLVGATMPAVLVEVGFITNPEEEKKLASDAHQAKIVSAIVRGLTRFLRERAQ